MAGLDTFAQLKHMSCEFERRDLHYPGTAFSLGTCGVATDIMTVRSGRGIQIGNYRSMAETIGNGTRFSGGYVVIELDHRMPHMMVFAKDKRGRRRRTMAPGLLRSQVV